MKNSLIVLAAGMGSRYGGIKQMDQIGPSGETILDYSVYDALRSGFDNVVFVLRKEIEPEFRTLVGSRIEKFVSVDYVCQNIADIPEEFSVPKDRNKPWGTGHAILVCADYVGDSFAVINADDFYGSGSFRVLGEFLSKTAREQDLSCLVGFHLGNTLSDSGAVSRGICGFRDDNALHDVEEVLAIVRDGDKAKSQGRKFTGQEIVSMNMWGFKHSLFDHLESQFKEFLSNSVSDYSAEFMIPTVVNKIITDSHGVFKVLETDSEWFGITYPDDRSVVVERVRQLVDRGVYPENLWK